MSLPGWGPIGEEKQMASKRSSDPIPPALADWKTAAYHLGAKTAAALRRRVERDPRLKRFVVHLTGNKTGIDLHRALAWFRDGCPGVDEVPPQHDDPALRFVKKVGVPEK